jgi:hypothetical protein
MKTRSELKIRNFNKIYEVSIQKPECSYFRNHRRAHSRSQKKYHPNQARNETDIHFNHVPPYNGRCNDEMWIDE